MALESKWSKKHIKYDVKEHTDNQKASTNR